MEKRNYKYDKIALPMTDEIPKILVSKPSYDTLPYVEEDIRYMEEEMDKITTVPVEEIENSSPEQRIESLGRRNSISLPNLVEIKEFTKDIQVCLHSNKIDNNILSKSKATKYLHQLSESQLIRRYLLYLWLPVKTQMRLILFHWENQLESTLEFF